MACTDDIPEIEVSSENIKEKDNLISEEIVKETEDKEGTRKILILSSYIILQRRNVDRGRKLEIAYTGEKPVIAF